MSAYLLVGLAILCVAGLGWFLWEIRKAPEGYEDKTGFHEGKEP